MSRNDIDKSGKKHGGLRSILCFIAVMISAAMVVTTQGQRPDDNPDRVVPVIPGADRYATGRIFLERADKLLKPAADVEYQVLTGNVLFRRGDMYMYCDSAHFYDATNSLQAFGNVKMEQGDTLFVYADELEYTDSTELAVLYADPGKKVRLINRDVELQTDIFNYDMGIELGYYEVGGELIDRQNRLTSIYGEYAPNSKDAIFRNRVHLSSLSEKDTLNIYTEALHYNTDTHIADLTDVSTITSKDGTIYTDSGVYNTETTVADLYSRSLVVTKTGKTLTGDTLFYDRKAGYGQAWGNMIINDTVNKSKLIGDYGFYNELTDSAFVTGHALAVDYSGPDSLSLHGDTIQAFRIITTILVPKPDAGMPIDSLVINTETSDSLLVETEVLSDTTIISDIAEPTDTIITTDIVLPADSITVPDGSGINDSTIIIEAALPPLQADIDNDSISVSMPSDTTVMSPALADAIVPAEEPVKPAAVPVKPAIPDGMMEQPDTTHHIVAYPNVRFFRNDLQGVCDSMTFVQKDSLLYMDRDPIVWSGERQIFGDEIIVHMNDSTADRITLPSNAFTAEMLEEGYFNQMSGREMVAYLADQTLKHLDISGNVMLIFFPMEEDSTYNKVASAESSFLSADFNKGQIEKLKMWPQSTEVITPLYLAKKSLFFLKDFRWEADRRPKGHDDLIPLDDAMKPEEQESPDTTAESDTPDKSDLTEETPTESTVTEPLINTNTEQ